MAEAMPVRYTFQEPCEAAAGSSGGRAECGTKEGPLSATAIRMTATEISIRERNMESRGIHVTAADIRDAQQMIYTPHNQAMLKIEPVNQQNPDFEGFRLPKGCKIVMPTEKFRVTWNGHSESFIREVTGIKELFEVLRPIVGEHVRAKNLLEKEFAKMSKLEREARIKEAQDSIRNFKLTLAAAEEKLEEVRGEG